MHGCGGRSNSTRSRATPSCRRAASSSSRGSSRARRGRGADFSELPRPTGRDATAANAPLVAAADCDLNSYLEARGDADIFFATDFDWLAKAYAAAGGVGTVTAIPPAEFFARSPDLAAETATRSGFNPMLEDFWNTRILSRAVGAAS